MPTKRQVLGRLGSKPEPRQKMPRDIMIRALVTKELFDKLAAAADREGRSLSAMIAILLREAIANRE
jgi:hypothetical protein